MMTFPRWSEGSGKHVFQAEVNFWERACIINSLSVRLQHCPAGPSRSLE